MYVGIVETVMGVVYSEREGQDVQNDVSSTGTGTDSTDLVLAPL